MIASHHGQDTWARYFGQRPVAAVLEGRDLGRDPCMLAIEILEDACAQNGDHFNDGHLADVIGRLDQVLRRAA